MVVLKQTNKYCRIDKDISCTKKCTIYCHEVEGIEGIKRLYLGFAMPLTDLVKVVYKPNVFWCENIVALSNSIYFDETRNECFVAVYAYNDYIVGDINVGTIECVEDLDVEVTEYTINKRAPINKDIVHLLRFMENGASDKEIAEIKQELNSFTGTYCFSWINTAVMLLRRNYIGIDEQGNVCNEYKWLFEEVRGLRENNIELRLKELVVNGVVE